MATYHVGYFYLHFLDDLVFLWIPLATLIAWYLGLDLVYFEMFEMEGFRAVIEDLFRFLTIVTLLGGALAVWAAYNYFRFKGREKRKTPALVDHDNLAEYFEVHAEELKRYQQEKLLTVEFDPEARIVSIQRLEKRDLG
nr:poly-beta-1,6-N-acetyl-D-glucosamine biosynthesis protein PgaD [Methylomarinum sp. Ch1-1]MDP4519215.1 poly-beta-1,6-N-acetyl-D-glucosamine biosynthesis protein PgaD [Methylomarinum sp. Ch1-1]